MVDSARHAETYQELCEHDPDLASDANQKFIPAWANSMDEEQNMSDLSTDENMDEDQHDEELAPQDEAQPSVTGNHAAASQANDNSLPEHTQANGVGADPGTEVDKKQALRRSELVTFNHLDNIACNAATAPHSPRIPRSDYNSLADLHLAACVQ